MGIIRRAMQFGNMVRAYILALFATIASVKISVLATHG
jgi:hypothetical protein